ERDARYRQPRQRPLADSAERWPTQFAGDAAPSILTRGRIEAASPFYLGSGRGAAWLARLLGVQEVPSSNLGGPTKEINQLQVIFRLWCDAVDKIVDMSSRISRELYIENLLQDFTLRFASERSDGSTDRKIRIHAFYCLLGISLLQHLHKRAQ